MQKTEISWTDKVWNPVLGCQHISEGCRNCYAERMTIRLNAIAAATGNEDLWASCTNVLRFDYTQHETGKAKGFNGNIKLMHNRLDQPLRWKKPLKVFVNSMSDLFHKEISTEFIDKILRIIAATPQHIYQILTKRADLIEEKLYGITDSNPCRELGGGDYLPNIWLGVSVENQQTADERIPLLLQIPAAIKWLSVEPILERINLKKYVERPTGWEVGKTPGGETLYSSYDYPIDWVVVGAESGFNRRPCKTEWIESIVDQCKEAHLPVFVKQMEIKGKISKNMEDFPEHLRIREYPND